MCAYTPTPSEMSEAGAPTECPPIADVLLGKWCQSTMDHLNTLECLTANPNGSILGRRGELKCANFSGCNQICMNTNSGPNSGTSWSCFCPSSTCPGGSDTQVQYNDGGTCGGDEGFTFTESTNLVNINEATDGDSVLLRLDNDLANSSGSTNETAQLRFGFGSDTDVARIRVGKINEFTDVSTSDVFLAFDVDGDAVSQEVLRIWGSDDAATISGYGVSIGTTARENATVEIRPINGSSSSNILLLSNGSGAANRIFRVTQGNSTINGDDALLSNYGLSVLSDSQASVTIQGRSSDAVASLVFGDEEGPTTTLELLNPSTASTAYYLELGSSGRTGLQQESPLIVFNEGSTSTQQLASGSTITNFRFNQFISPTINGLVGGAIETVTNGATVYISDAPSGSNITFTNGPYALWVDAGSARFDGAVEVASIDTGGGVALELAAGQWTPTTNNIANLDSSSVAEGQYMRVGATVTGSIQLTVDPTTANTSTQLELDLPIASNFGATSDAAGSCGSPDIEDEVGAIRADITSDELEVLWITNSAASHELDCSFSYQII